MKILLGFDGTAKLVYLREGHTVITGLTQESGKTTGLEALVARGKIRAISFITKRGEKGFTGQRMIQPYFKEQRKGEYIDWQYVQDILESTMGEKMKWERSYIINASKSAKSLEDVYQNIRASREKATRGFDLSVFTNLSAYFEIVLPQIEERQFASKLSLKKGFNVMDLTDMTDEMQSLVIQSTMEYIYRRMKNVVVIIPEAHKFIPQGFKNPVKPIAQRYIREGAAIKNFLWIDSQETVSVDKTILKQCSNWIMGYQQERNEIKNVRENLGKRAVKPEDIMNLKLGHFIARINRKIHFVYVWPDGVPEEMAKEIALGLRPPEDAKEFLRALREGSDEDMYRRKYEETQRELDKARTQIESLKKEKPAEDEVPQEDLDNLKKQLQDVTEQRDKAYTDAVHMDQVTKRQTEEINVLKKELTALEATKAFIESMREILVPHGAVQVTAQGIQDAVDVEMEVEAPSLEVKHIRKVVKLDGDTVEGKILLLWVDGKVPQDKWTPISKIRVEFQNRAWSWSNPNGRRALDTLTRWGFLESMKAGNRPQWRPTMTPSEAMEKGLLKVEEVLEK